MLLLLIVIPSLWIAVVAFFVLLCRGAARADAVMMATASSMSTAPRVVRRGAVTVFDVQRNGAPSDTAGVGV
jgi:hypothetical protein